MSPYVCLLMFIVLVTWELLEDNQFPSVEPDLPEVAKYASLWKTKDVQCIKDNKIICILMEMKICMAINRKPSCRLRCLPTYRAM